jgi:Tfp pilus assembly protein PilX
MARRRWLAAVRATVSGRRRDEGAALVMVIGVLMVTAVVAVTVASASLFATRATTGTRAAVQARAAAEAGIDVVASKLFGAVSTCAGPTIAQATAPAYSVAVSYKPSGYSGTVWTSGCPPTDASAVRLISTGTAASTAANVPAQNTKQVEQVWTRNTAGPAFTKAIFGDLTMALNTNMVVSSPSGATDADVFTNGDFTCSSAMTIQGDLYVKGNATWSSSPCTINGDVYIEGNLTCASGTTVGGNLYVQGWYAGTGSGGSNACRVAKDVWVGGTGSTSTVGGLVVGGSLLVRGNYSMSGYPEVTGSIRVGGAIVDGTGGNFWSLYPTATQHDGGVGMPPTIPASADNVFPKLTKTSAQWAGFQPVDWKNARLSTLSAASETNVCTPHSGTTSKPLTITTNTQLDATSYCSGATDFNGLRIVLYADAVVFVNQYKQAGTTEIVSGDGQPHSLYIVQPWTSAGSTCSTSTTGINFTYGTWTQDAKTKVMLYSAGKVEFHMTPTIRGQIYGCSVQADTGFTINYDPVGAVAATPAGLQALTLGYTRDL